MKNPYDYTIAEIEALHPGARIYCKEIVRVIREDNERETKRLEREIMQQRERENKENEKRFKKEPKIFFDLRSLE